MKNVYHTAILFLAVQSLLIVTLTNNNYMKVYSFFQLSNPDLFASAFGLIIVFLDVLAIVVINRLYKSGLEAQQLKMTAQKYDNLIEQNRIYRQHHHDLKNHLTVVLGLLTLGKHGELKDYLNSYLQTINDGLLKLETGLDEIDILLASKFHLAKGQETRLELDLQTSLRCSRQNILDLVAILGNVLDNALDAVREFEQPKRYVSICFDQDPVEYIFRITNPTSATCSIQPDLYLKEGFSTKGESRGQGLFIVKRLTEKLGGSVTVEASEGYFRVTIEIPRHRLEE